jgi:hypothetical protein
MLNINKWVYTKWVWQVCVLNADFSLCDKDEISVKLVKQKHGQHLRINMVDMYETTWSTIVNTHNK